MKKRERELCKVIEAKYRKKKGKITGDEIIQKLFLAFYTVMDERKKEKKKKKEA